MPAGWIAQWDNSYVAFEAGARVTCTAPPSHWMPRDTADSRQITEILLCVAPTSSWCKQYRDMTLRLTTAPDVQISTGVSQWDLPTSEAPIGGSSSHSTPAQSANPYNKPGGAEVGDGTRGVGGHGESTDRAGGLGV